MTLKRFLEATLSMFQKPKKERRRDLQNQALVTVCSQIAEALCLRTRPIKVVYYDRPSASFRVQLRPP